MTSTRHLDIGFDQIPSGYDAGLPIEADREVPALTDMPVSRRFLARGQAFERVDTLNKTTYRIVETIVDEKAQQAIILAVQLNTKRTIIKAIPLETFSEELGNERIKFIEDPWAALWMDKVPSTKSLIRRDQRYELILSLIKKRYWNLSPSVLQSEIYDLSESSGYSDRAIEHALRDYLQNGQSRHALTPLWFSSGLTGKRIAKLGGAKRGRPGKLKQLEGTDLFETGCNITPRIEVEFQVIYEKFVKKGIAKSDAAAHQLVLLIFYSNLPQFIDDLELVPIMERPTGDAYKKWRQVNIGAVAHRNNKQGDGDYQRNRRPKVGTSRDMVSGPYKLWQTDVKTVRSWITTPLAPGLVIKSISLCIYVDMFDSIITGHYVGPERESQIVYLLALQDATKDGHVPDGIFGDRGPIEGKKITALIKDITIEEIHNAPPYRPDMKGLVESLLGVVVELALKWYPNAGTHLDKGDANHILPVRLSLSQLRKLIAIAIRLHNNAIWLKKYSVRIESLPDMIEKSPVGLQQYGFDLYGEPRWHDPKVIMQSALKVGRGSITGKGLRNIEIEADYYYTCPEIETTIENAANSKSTEPVEIRYDPRDANILSVLYAGKLCECHIIENETSKMFQHRDLAEITLHMLFDRLLQWRSSEKRLVLQLKGDLEAMSVMLETPEAEALMKAKGITPKQFANLIEAIQSLPSGDTSVADASPQQLDTESPRQVPKNDNGKRSNYDDYSDLFGYNPVENS